MKKLKEFSFEDAITETKFGKFNYILIVLSGLLLAVGFLEASCISLILPIAQCELNLSNFNKGLLGSISYVGIILSSHFWGFMADTKGRKRVIVPALFLSFLFTFISTFSKSFWFLLLFRFLNGVCICAPQGITYAYLGEFHSLKNRARVLTSASVLYGIFCQISPLNGFLFVNQENISFYIPFLDINYGTWRMFLIMCAVPSIVSAICMIIFIPESPKYTYAQGDEEKTLKILQRIYACNTGKSADEYPVKSLLKDEEFLRGESDRRTGFFQFMWTQTAPLFKSPHLKNTLTACYIQFGICVSSNGFFTFFPEILNKVSIWLDNNDPSVDSATVCEVLDSFNRNMNVSLIIDDVGPCIKNLETSTLMNIVISTFAFSTLWLISSIIINRTGKLVIIVTILFAGGISSTLIMLLKWPNISVYLYFVILVASVNMSIINSSIVELYPTNLRAMAVLISMMAGRTGSVVASNFVGIMLKSYCSYTWLLPTVLSISGGLLSFTIPNINKRIS